MKRQLKQSRVSIRRLLCVSLLIILISIFSSMRVSSITDSYNPSYYSSLTPHDPISITSNSDFEVFPGLGTAEDPYVIEEYSITTTSNIGIYISSTTKYFIVRNCYVDASDYGIQIRYVADGSAIVINNTCNNNWIGIALEVSVSSTVTNNTCSNNNGCGIILIFSDSSIVANNTCNNDYGEGIVLDNSGDSTVVNNTCSNNNYGIYFSSSDFCVVTYNLLQE
ncbi:MAG: right-handed parallel beta-helix repeat-containing protein, partial [Candidatus Heimdallarchaeota archaeon]|nr:right-handed parallel beta-helix repeat-containing protein [Candidatus Heimdallarchaeota archaeon]